MTTPPTQTRITGMSGKGTSGTIPARGELRACTYSIIMSENTAMLIILLFFDVDEPVKCASDHEINQC